MYIELDKTKQKALYIQLYEAISEDIISGRLRNGIKLPSRRALAEQLGISQNTVDGAYKMLQDTGYIVSVPRQGYIVSFKASVYDRNIPWEINAPESVVFSPNGIDISRINRPVYAKIMKDIVYNYGVDIFSYIEKGGEFALRNVVSKYLYSFRDVKCSPDRIIIGAGAEYLLTALAGLFPAGVSFIAENPCDTHFYRTLTAYKNSVLTLPLNTEKFDMDALYASEGNILLLEPDARFPRSSALSEAERREILAWAEQSEGRYIIENSLDSEIQWETHKTLYSMDRYNKVIYLGAFSRAFSPALKTAYMVLPPELLALWKQKHVYYYALSSKAEQFALAEFIGKGYFTKHYKAMRRIYKERRSYLTDRFDDAFGNRFILRGTAGSTYITAELAGIPVEDIKKAARHCGVKLLSMNSYNINKDTDPIAQDRLVIGFGDLSHEKINLGVQLIRDAWDRAGELSYG